MFVTRVLFAVPDLPVVPEGPVLPSLPGLPGLPIPTDPLVLLAYLLLLAGIAGSVVPIPSGLLSLAGVLLHAWRVGRPGGLLLPLLVLLAVGATLADWFGGPVAAKVGGARTRSAAAGGVVGLFGALLLGPLGLVVGLAGTIFALEYRRHGDEREGARAAAIATAGVLAAAAVQIVATTLVLVGVVLG